MLNLSIPKVEAEALFCLRKRVITIFVSKVQTANGPYGNHVTPNSRGNGYRQMFAEDLAETSIDSV